MKEALNNASYTLFLEGSCGLMDKNIHKNILVSDINAQNLPLHQRKLIDWGVLKLTFAYHNLVQLTQLNDKLAD